MVQLNLETTIRLFPNKSVLRKKSTRYHFVVVGAGGTGGHLLPNLIRQVGVHNRSLSEDVMKHSVVVIDADDVETSNLIRQNFTQNDLGKNKAKVMATRYGRAFGVNVGYIEEYITSPKELILMAADSYLSQSDLDIFYGERESALKDNNPENFMDTIATNVVVFIDATDNNKTRFLIEEAARRWKGTAIVLSSGNESSAGQVIFSMFPYGTSNTLNEVWDKGGLFSDSGPIETPSFFDVFPDSPFEKLPTEVSCAESTVSAPQNMIANVTAANILFNYVNKLLAYEPIQVFLTFFDTDGMTQSVYHFTKTDVTRALQLTEGNKNLARYVTGSYEGLDKSTPTWTDFEKARIKEEREKAEEISKIFAGVLPS